MTNTEFLETIATLGTLIAAFIALLSFLWALFRWREQRIHDELQTFRAELTNIRSAAKLFQENMSDITAIEIGNLAAGWVISNARAENTQDLKHFLKNCDPTEIYIGAFLYGYNSSKNQQMQLSALSQMRNSTGRQNESFPISNRLFETFSQFFARSVHVGSTIRGVKGLIEENIVPDRVIDEIDDNDPMGIVFSKISDMFSGICAVGYQSSTKSTFIASEIIDLISSVYLEQTDSELRGISKTERSKLKILASIDNETFTEDFSSYIDLLKEILSGESWTKAVELRTQLHSHFE